MKKILIAKIINKSSLLVRKWMPWLFSYLSRQQGLRKLYLRNKHLSYRGKHISQTLNTDYLFPNKDKEINLALEQAMTSWPKRKRLHG